MKYLLVGCLMLLSLNAMAQNCKYDYDKKDPFSGKMSKGITATIQKTWKLGFNRNGDDYSLGVVITLTGVHQEVIHTGDTLMLAMTGSDPVMLFAAADANPTSTVAGGNQIVTWYQGMYKISKEDVQRIAGTLPVAIRVYLGTIFVSLDIPDKNAEKIRKAATCIQQ